MNIKFMVLSWILLIFTGKNVWAQDILFCIEDKDYLPYIALKEGKSNTSDGILILSVKKAAALVGINPLFIRKPWKRCQADVLTGKAQSLMAMIKTPERVAKFAFPDDMQFMQEVEYPIVVKRGGKFDSAYTKSNILFDTNNQFDLINYQKHKISGLDAPLGYVIYQYFEQHKILTPFNSGLLNSLKLVASGRLDGYAVERFIGKNAIHVTGLSEKLVLTEGAVMKHKWYAPFNPSFYKSHKTLVSEFWHVLHQMSPEVTANYSYTEN